MPMLVDRGRPDDAMRQRAEALLESMGLTPWRDSLAMNMSGGQQQRVAVARALAMNPSLVLADEPTGNLDTKSAQGVFDLLRQVNVAHRTTVLVVTHNHALAAAVRPDRRARRRADSERPATRGSGRARLTRASGRRGYSSRSFCTSFPPRSSSHRSGSPSASGQS